MNGNSSVPDVIGLFVFIATLLFSSEVAAVIGPYMVIVIAASIGGSFALARREPGTRAEAVWFFFRVVGLAVLMTAGIAYLVAMWHPEFSPRLTIAPIALVLGYVEWPSLLAKIVRGIFAALDFSRGKGGTQ